MKSLIRGTSPAPSQMQSLLRCMPSETYVHPAQRLLPSPHHHDVVHSNNILPWMNGADFLSHHNYSHGAPNDRFPIPYSSFGRPYASERGLARSYAPSREPFQVEQNNLYHTFPFAVRPSSKEAIYLTQTGETERLPHDYGSVDPSFYQKETQETHSIDVGHGHGENVYSHNATTEDRCFTRITDGESEAGGGLVEQCATRENKTKGHAKKRSIVMLPSINVSCVYRPPRRPTHGLTAENPVAVPSTPATTAASLIEPTTTATKITTHESDLHAVAAENAYPTGSSSSLLVDAKRNLVLKTRNIDRPSWDLSIEQLSSRLSLPLTSCLATSLASEVLATMLPGTDELVTLYK